MAVWCKIDDRGRYNSDAVLLSAKTHFIKQVNNLFVSENIIGTALFQEEITEEVPVSFRQNSTADIGTLIDNFFKNTARYPNKPVVTFNPPEFAVGDTKEKRKLSLATKLFPSDDDTHFKNIVNSLTKKANVIEDKELVSLISKSISLLCSQKTIIDEQKTIMLSPAIPDLPPIVDQTTNGNIYGEIKTTERGHEPGKYIKGALYANQYRIYDSAAQPEYFILEAKAPPAQIKYVQSYIVPFWYNVYWGKDTCVRLEELFGHPYYTFIREEMNLTKQLNPKVVDIIKRLKMGYLLNLSTFVGE